MYIKIKFVNQTKIEFNAKKFVGTDQGSQPDNMMVSFPILCHSDFERHR